MSTALPAMLHTLMTPVMTMISFICAAARRKDENVIISDWNGSAAAVMRR